MKIIKATKRNELSDLKHIIEDELTSDLCVDVVNLAYSEDNKFTSDVFLDSATFFDTLINEEPINVAIMFFDGKDLDDRGQANPDKAYFRLDKRDNVESTDYPGDIYYDDLLDEIVDYIMDHIDDREFPAEIQDIITEYQDKE